MFPLPFLAAVHVKSALDNRGPLEAADDERVGPGTLRLHQLTLYTGQTRQTTDTDTETLLTPIEWATDPRQRNC